MGLQLRGGQRGGEGAAVLLRVHRVQRKTAVTCSPPSAVQLLFLFFFLFEFVFFDFEAIVNGYYISFVAFILYDWLLLCHISRHHK